MKLKIEHFLLKIAVLINQVFATALTTFGFRCKIIRVKLLLFGVNTNIKMLMITKARN